MTPLVLESHRRSVKFHAEIAHRASLVPQREDRSYSVPNTPYGIPKIAPVRTVFVYQPDYGWTSMWFYQLVFGPLESRKRSLSISSIQITTANHFGVSLIDLLSPRRTAAVVWARQVAAYLCKTMTLRTLPEIGRRFGGRDHTTILHAVRKIERLMKSDMALAADIAAIKTRIAA